jgi:hypothetical protein
MLALTRLSAIEVIRPGGGDPNRPALLRPLNDRAKAGIGVEKVIGGIHLDPENVCGTLSVTLLEQSERRLFVTKLCVITRQLNRRDVP